jgi:hypothetical protein
MNKYGPCLLVLPEDDRNRQIANGFIQHPALKDCLRNIQILPVIGGWTKAVEEFENVYTRVLQRYPKVSILLIIDFDHQVEKRLLYTKNKILEQLIDRVFILGTLSEPEKLKTNLGKSYEDIGKDLSQDCADNTRTVWEHELLKHNKTELDRMISLVKPFLFNSV